MAELDIFSRKRVSVVELDPFTQRELDDQSVRRYFPRSYAGYKFAVRCQVDKSFENIVADRGRGDTKLCSRRDPAYQVLPGEPL